MLKRIPKKLLMIVGPLVCIAALYFLVLPKVNIQIGSAQPAATPIVAEGVGGEHAEPTEVVEEKHGFPLPLPERVVNLADPGGYRYLKTELVLELNDENVKVGAEGVAAAQTELTNELATVMPQIQDIVTTVLTTKTVADVSTAAGKDLVKAELIEKLAPLLEEHEHELMAIYFQQFLIQ